MTAGTCITNMVRLSLYNKAKRLRTPALSDKTGWEVQGGSGEDPHDVAYAVLYTRLYMPVIINRSIHQHCEIIDASTDIKISHAYK